MGVCNIILYDNNNVDGEYPQQVIGDYIANGFVIYNNVRGYYRYQIPAYNDGYCRYKDRFDWIGFLDIDEYWYLSPHLTFDDFFSEERLPNAGAIYLNWLCYGDNGLIHYDSRPMYERFTRPTFPINFKSGDFEVNKIKKMFLRCSEDVFFLLKEVNDVEYTYMARRPEAYMANGELYDIDKINFQISYIKHYRTLTIEEFLYKRFGRRSVSDLKSVYNLDHIMEYFWGQNEWTEEKQNIIDDFFNNFEVIEDNICDDDKQ